MTAFGNANNLYGWGKVQRQAQSTWWITIKSPRGKTGWTKERKVDTFPAMIAAAEKFAFQSNESGT